MFSKWGFASFDLPAPISPNICLLMQMLEKNKKRYIYILVAKTMTVKEITMWENDICLHTGRELKILLNFNFNLCIHIILAGLSTKLGGKFYSFFLSFALHLVN